MRRKIKEFIVRDENEQSYLLILYQDFLESDDQDGTDFTEANKVITLETGEHVDRIEKGVYALPNGKVLTTSDPWAP